VGGSLYDVVVLDLILQRHGETDRVMSSASTDHILIVACCLLIADQIVELDMLEARNPLAMKLAMQHYQPPIMNCPWCGFLLGEG